jgi:hypothetical protein
MRPSSYSLCAIRIVSRAERRSFLFASCWRVEVVNGGAGRRTVGFSSVSLTTQSAVLEPSRKSASGGLAEQQDRAALDQPARRLVEIASSCYPRPADRYELSGEFVPRPGEERLQVPVGTGAERPPFPFALHQEPDGDGLDPPGGEARRDLLPQEGGDGVADETVQDSTRFLGPDEVLVDLPRVPERGFDRLGRDLVEDDP